MNATPELVAELDRLIFGLLLDGLSAQEHSRLDQLVADQVDLRRRYLERMFVAGELCFMAAEERAVEPVAAPAARLQPVPGFLTRTVTSLFRPSVLIIGGVSLASVTYVLLLFWGLLDGKSGRRVASDDRETARSEQAVATITASKDAEWQTDKPNQHSSFSIQHSEVPRSAPLSLASGTVALQLKKGVNLTIQGPAEWTIDGDNRATLTRGKLIATVPHQAIGFTVKTPTTEIVDLGTEFGVEVGDRGETRTHVFRGEIRVEQPALAAAPAKRAITLTAGQAVSIDRGGNATFIQPLAATPAQFIRPPNATAEDVFNPDILSPYARYVIDETKPVAYWDFSWYRNSMKIVHDRMTGRAFDHFAPEHVGMLGPAASKGFAGFGETNPAIAQRWNSAQPAGLYSRQPQLAKGDYSMALWVRPTSVTSQPIYYLACMGDGASSQPEGACDSVLLSGTIRPEMTGKLRYYDGTNNPLPTGKSVLTPGKWYSVALVRQADKVFVYLDGQLEIEAAARRDGKRGDTFTFGQRTDMQANLAFTGQLDETILWDRALTSREVSDIYQRAIRAPNPKP